MPEYGKITNKKLNNMSLMSFNFFSVYSYPIFVSLKNKYNDKKHQDIENEGFTKKHLYNYQK